eukprot:2357279-Karenia_brevis.AAC.1
MSDLNALRYTSTDNLKNGCQNHKAILQRPISVSQQAPQGVALEPNIIQHTTYASNSDSIKI